MSVDMPFQTQHEEMSQFTMSKRRNGAIPSMVQARGGFPSLAATAAARGSSCTLSLTLG